MQCRVCGSPEITFLGNLEYYSGFVWPVFDCIACRCRFSQHRESIYNWLHSSPTSIYALYRDLAEKSKRLFDRNDLGGLRRELCATSKYKFIMEAVEEHGKRSKLLEVGCSRGYFTSYFILAGYDITGVDASPGAVQAAHAAFGDHFVEAGSAAVQERAPYDVIYHAGTIGCVGDPLGLTSELVRMLAPGGKLVFNAPNASGCWRKGQLWLDEAPPPDVVTLFRPGFWQKRFCGVARVEETVELCPSDRAFTIGVSKLLGRSWQKPVPLPLDASAKCYQNGRPAGSKAQKRLANLLDRGSAKIGRLTGLVRLAPSQPAPFGLFITMTKL